MKSVFARNDKEIVRVSLAADNAAPRAQNDHRTPVHKTVSNVP